jgi:hypothetical protein
MASTASTVIAMRIMGQEARPSWGGRRRAWSVCRPLLSRGGWARERAARTRGWLAAQSPPRAQRRAAVTSTRNMRRRAVGYALDSAGACSLRPIFCALAPFPAAMAMFSSASPFVRTGVIMPHRNSCLKRASPAPVSHGAGLHTLREVATGITPRSCEARPRCRRLAADK